MRISGAAILAFISLPLLAQSQVVVRDVPDGATCSRCVVSMRPVLTLDSASEALTGLPLDVFVGARGQVFVAEYPELPRVFSSRGQYIGELGTRGGGPGEFREVVGFSRLPEDSLLVHRADDRVSVVDPTGKSIRDIALPGPLFPVQVVRWPDRIISTGYIGTSAAAGFQLHVLDFSSTPARVMSSFGWENGRFRPNSGGELRQFITAPRDGTFWSADPLEYRLARWSVDGVSRLMLKRSPVWFQGRSEAWHGNPTTPPPPSIIGISEDAAGLVWVYSRVPSSNWRAAWPRLAPGTREIAVRALAVEKLYDIVLEVIDPRTLRVKVTQNLSQSVVDVLQNGDVVTYRTQADGSPVISILRPSLREP